MTEANTKIAIMSLRKGFCHQKTDILTYISFIRQLAHLSLIVCRPENPVRHCRQRPAIREIPDQVGDDGMKTVEDDGYQEKLNNN